MKFIFLFIIILTSILPQQIDKEIPGFLFSINKHSIGEGNFGAYYSYKIQYDKLVFKLENNTYTAKFRFTIEINDIENNIILRKDQLNEVHAKDFDETNSKNKFASGVIKFDIEEGEYFVNPFIEDLNSSKEFPLTVAKLNYKNNSNILDPIAVVENICFNKSSLSLLSFNNKIPFQKDLFQIIIPTSEIDISNLDVKIINNGKEIFNENLIKKSETNYNFSVCNNEIIFGSGGNNNVSVFILENISKLFEEGELIININTRNEISYNFKYEVFWFNKPLSLNNPDFAIKILKHIENEDVIKQLRRNDKDEYYKVLNEYWKKFDPSPDTKFNELMDEFYRRVDFSWLNFSTLNGKNGAETDRGKIYITQGKPIKIERDRNDKGKITEIWFYENPLRQYYFTDLNGTGDYVLAK